MCIADMPTCYPLEGRTRLTGLSSGGGTIFLDSVLSNDNDCCSGWIFMKETTTSAFMEILPVAEEHLPALAELAGVIWRQHYPGIISHEQIDYMLGKMYSLDTLREEIRLKGIHFVRLLANGMFIGFASFGPTPEFGVMKLHKCYLLPEMHGRGYGSQLLQHCEREARKLGARRLILAVNKRNTKAVTAYQRNGFVVADSVITDFGAGFVMDDYIMAKDLT
jgi:GNAT superfamily N-acetyltransferase